MKRLLIAAGIVLLVVLVALGGYLLSHTIVSGGSAHGNNRRTATVATLFVSTQGSDQNPCSQSAPCYSLNAAYQRASAGDIVQVAAGSYPNQVLSSNASLRNLSPGCTTATTAQCVRFVGSGVTIGGPLEIHGSDVWVDGGTAVGSPGFDIAGYVDTESDSNSVYPDHIIVQGTHSTSFGVFNANTVTFRWMDVGPATVSSGCGILQGRGFENKIGWAGGNSVVPTNITLDGLLIHDQNADSGRIASDCHFGGLFLVTADGLTVRNTVFQNNVVYNVQIQNFGGAPAPTNVTFNNDSFGCPVDWLYQGAGCDGQASIQFDGTFPGITITNNRFAGGDYGCYVGTCSYTGDTIVGNTLFAASTAAPPLDTTTTTTATTTTAPTTTAATTTPTTTTTPATTPAYNPSCAPTCDTQITDLKTKTAALQARINKAKQDLG